MDIERFRWLENPGKHTDCEGRGGLRNREQETRQNGKAVLSQVRCQSTSEEGFKSPRAKHCAQLVPHRKPEAHAPDESLQLTESQKAWEL